MSELAPVLHQKGSLSRDAQKYCQLDVEAPIELYLRYQLKPDLTLRLNSNVLPPIRSTVDVMPESGTATDAIAQGTIKQIGGRWLTNRKKLSSKQVLIRIEKVFNVRGIIHYPCTASNQKACSCQRTTHGKIEDTCDFYFFSQFGKPPFYIMELLSRLRLFNTQIEYPPCVYDDDSSPSEEEMDELTNFMDRVQLYTEPTIDEDTVGDKTSNLQESDENSISESSSISSEYDSDTSDIEMRINETALQLIDDDDGNATAYSSDGDSSIKSNREEDPTELEIQMGSNVEFNVTLKKIH